jgi:3-oxoacyl-[acyl-carrier-protein] synthase-3
MNIKIISSGSYIPPAKVQNEAFANHVFMDSGGAPLTSPIQTIIQTFEGITGIKERRYIDDDLVTSDIAYLASQKAIDDSGIDPESLDYIILAHNFGDVVHGKGQTDMVPSLASRVKHKLKIKNAKCVAYDVIFGCPGWIEGMLQANALIKSGMAKRCLVVGAETLSRVTDPHDRDSMIYADGAGAVVVEGTTGNEGLLSYESASYTDDANEFLCIGKSYNQHMPGERLYLKMYGRKIYEFALNHVPDAMKSCLDKSGIPIHEVKKILIHQANSKMDEAILQRFYKLYDALPAEGVMPLSIGKLGNSSVATVPTLYDLIVKGELENQELQKGDIVLFASVGAGMNINAFTYRM